MKRVVDVHVAGHRPEVRLHVTAQELIGRRSVDEQRALLWEVNCSECDDHGHRRIKGSMSMRVPLGMHATKSEALIAADGHAMATRPL